MAGKSSFGKFNDSLSKGVKAFGKPLTDSKTKGNIFGKYANAITSEDRDVLSKREATFPARSHRDIALKNVGGGAIPEFSNSNLYGFAMMTFTGGWDSGWNVIDVKSVLKPPVTAAFTGGDEVGNATDYFFNVNPKAIAVSEPNAVHIVPTQNNGFYVESQGTVLRRLSISGTTGFRPARSKLNEDQLLPNNPDEPTGYLNHIKLRNLFRNYSQIKKDAKQAKNTYMVWYNGYTQEAWFCEPESFSTSKDASSPFISRYEIGITLLHKVAFSAITTKLSPGNLGQQFWLESIRLASLALNRDNIPGWMKTANNVSKEVARTIDIVSEGVKTVESYITNGLALGGTALGIIPALAAPIMQSTKNLLFNTKSLVDTSKTIVDSLDNTLGDFGGLWEDFGADIQSIATSVIWSTNALILSELYKNGDSIKSNIEEDNKYYRGTGGNINPPNDDYIYIESKVPKSINDLDTILGNNGAPPSTKPLLNWANNLKYPYISPIPSSNTLVPGDTIYIPYPNGKKIPDNIETKLFPLNIKLGLNEELLGRDIKLVSMVTGTGQKSFDFGISDTGDLDLVESKDNMIQAIYIKLNVERGELDLHPWFGFIDVIGMKSTLNLSFATNLAINDTMLSDGRIESISGLTIDVTGDTMRIKLKAHIYGQSAAVPVTVSTGA